MNKSRIYSYECKNCGGKVTKPKLEPRKEWADMSPSEFKIGLGKWFCEVERKKTTVKASFKVLGI